MVTTMSAQHNANPPVETVKTEWANGSIFRLAPRSKGKTGFERRNYRKQPNPRRWEDVVWLGCIRTKANAPPPTSTQVDRKLPRKQSFPLYRKTEFQSLPEEKLPTKFEFELLSKVKGPTELELLPKAKGPTEFELVPKARGPTVVRSVAKDPLVKIWEAFTISSRAEDIIQRYVKQVSRPRMDTVQIGLKIRPGFPELTRAEKRIVSRARGAIVNHENYTRFPNAGLHNILDDHAPLVPTPQRLCLSVVTRSIQPHVLCIPEVLEYRTLPLSTAQNRNYAYEKRAVQMHEAALAFLAKFDDRPPGSKGLPMDP